MSDCPPDELAARRNQSGRNAPYRWTAAQDSRLPAHAFEPMSAGFEYWHSAPGCRCVLRLLTRRERLALWWREARIVILPMAVGLALGFGMVFAVFAVR